MIADTYAALREFVKWAMEGWTSKSLEGQKRLTHSDPARRAGTGEGEFHLLQPLPQRQKHSISMQKSGQR